jgi:cell division protein FtsB
MDKMAEQEKYYKNEYAKSIQKTRDLNKMQELSQNESYIEKQAREKLGMVKPNEKVYIDITK